MLRRRGKIPATPLPVERDAVEAAACVYAAKLLDQTREEVNKADAKAQVLLGVAGVAVGAVAGGLIAQSWSPSSLSNTVEWLWWAGVGATLTALACLAGAVYPRTGNSRGKDPRTVGYYADVLRFGSVQALTTALLGYSRPDLRRISDQLRRVSEIVQRKYRLIRWGFWLLTTGVTAAIGSLLLDRML